MPSSSGMQESAMREERRAQEAQFVVPKKYMQATMLFDMQCGGEPLNLEAAAKTARGLLETMWPMVIAPMAQQAIESIVVEVPPACPVSRDEVREHITRILMNFKRSLSEQMEDILRGPFGIIDSNDSGYISKKEFLGLYIMVTSGMEMFNSHFGEETMMKSVLSEDFINGLFWILDASDDGEISKEEVSQYVFKVLTGCASLCTSSLRLLETCIDAKFYEAVASHALPVGASFLQELPVDVDIFTSSQSGYPPGSLHVAKTKSFLMGVSVPFVQAMRQKRIMQVDALGGDFLRGFVDSVNKVAGEGLSSIVEKFASNNAAFTEDDFAREISTLERKIIQQVTDELLTIQIPQFQSVMAQMNHYGVNLGEVVSNAMTEKCFDRSLRSFFRGFISRAGLLSPGRLDEFQKMYIRWVSFMNSKEPVDAMEREAEAAFRGILDFAMCETDRDADGIITPNETARLLKAYVNFVTSVFQDVIEIYARIVSNRQFVIAGCQLLEDKAAANWGIVKQMYTGICPLRFPLTKSWCLHAAKLVIDTSLQNSESAPGANVLARVRSTDCEQGAPDQSQMLDHIFQWADITHDGFLNFEELNRLAAATSGQGMSIYDFQALCSFMGADTTTGLTPDHLSASYNAGCGDIETDWKKLRSKFPSSFATDIE